MTLHNGAAEMTGDSMFGYDNPQIVAEITNAIWTGFESLYMLIESSHLPPGEAELASSCYHFTLKYFRAPCNFDEATQLAAAFDKGDATSIQQLMPAWGRALFEILARNNSKNGLKLEAFLRAWIRDMKNWERRNESFDSRNRLPFRRNKDDEDIKDPKDDKSESSKEI